MNAATEITIEDVTDSTGLDRYADEIRSLILQKSNTGDLKILQNFATGPGTTDQDAKHAAHAMKRAGVGENEAHADLQALYEAHYPGDSRAINRVIAHAYHPGQIAKFKSKPRVIKVTEKQRLANIKEVFESGIEPLGIQPDAKEMKICDILPSLYGEDPETLVCLARSVSTAKTKPLGEWLKLGEEQLLKHQLRCANPMRKLIGKNNDGNDSDRCKDNATESLDLLTYETDHRDSNDEEQLRLINYIAQSLPLVSVCKSGNASIHATYSIKGLSNELKRQVKDRFAALGGDTMVMEAYHLMRTPNATRNDSKATREPQALLWIDGSNREREADERKLEAIGIFPDDIVGTEVQESQLFQKFLGIDYLFNETRGWLRWNGNNWQIVGNGILLGEAMEFQKNAIERGEKKRSKMLGRKNTLQNIVDLTKSTISPELKIEDFDNDPFLLAVNNGTNDLKQGTEGFRSPDRADMISRVIGIAYDPDATCPIWEAFLSRIFRTHKEVIPYIQRFCGYCLTGDVSEQIFAFLYGGGSNGKSTFIKVLEGVLGSYATKLPKAAYVTTRNGKVDTALSHLEHVRVAVGDELNEREVLAEGTIKTLSGGDKLQARRLHKMEFEFEPTHKFIMFGNHKPRINGTDLGIWRRLHLVPFVEEIEGHEKDRQLGEKLAAELPGILNWMIDGCQSWQAEGLNPPAVMIEASQAYRGDEDVIQQFISECLDLEDPEARETRDLIYTSYSNWSKRDGATPKTKKNFFTAIREKGIIERGRKFCCQISEDHLDFPELS
jgi:putative DNA primase/helicase